MTRLGPILSFLHHFAKSYRKKANNLKFFRIFPYFLKIYFLLKHYLSKTNVYLCTQIFDLWQLVHGHIG